MRVSLYVCMHTCTYTYVYTHICISVTPTGWRERDLFKELAHVTVRAVKSEI